MKKRENNKVEKPFLILIAGAGKTTVAKMITKQSGKKECVCYCL
jgi:uridine kinase